MLQIYISYNPSQSLYYLVYRKREGKSILDSISTVSGPWERREVAERMKERILRQAEMITEV